MKLGGDIAKLFKIFVSESYVTRSPNRREERMKLRGIDSYVIEGNDCIFELHTSNKTKPYFS